MSVLLDSTNDRVRLAAASEILDLDTLQAARREHMGASPRTPNGGALVRRRAAEFVAHRGDEPLDLVVLRVGQPGGKGF